MKNGIINEMAAVIGKKYNVPEGELVPLMHYCLADYELTKKETALAIPDEKTNEYYIKKFLVAKRVKGCTHRTIEHYGNTLFRVFGEVNKTFTEITSDDLLIIAAVWLRNGNSKTMISNNQRVLSSFFAWATNEELIAKNPFNKIDIMKCDTKKETALEDMEVELMRAECRSSKETAILEILLSTGCRASELVSIKLQDINDDGEISILGKGEKWRRVYLNAKAKVALKKYVGDRKDANPYLFPRMKSINESRLIQKLRKEAFKNPECVDPARPMNKETANDIIKKIAKKAGIERRVHTHLIRKTFATHALRNGMPIEQVSKMLGHESLETTQIYLTVTEDELARSHARYVK